LVKLNLTKIVRARRAGIVRPRRAFIEAARAGIPFYVLCAFLEQETAGGHNIFGHDAMRCGSDIRGRRVTRRRYKRYLRKRGPTCTSGCGCQGVGPLQITYYSLQDEADQLGGCWKPRINLRYGAMLLADYRKVLGSWHAAAARFNGSEEYADRNDALRDKWEQIIK
jgi:hypothetical protein